MRAEWWFSVRQRLAESRVGLVEGDEDEAEWSGGRTGGQLYARLTVGPARRVQLGRTDARWRGLTATLGVRQARLHAGLMRITIERPHQERDRRAGPRIAESTPSCSRMLRGKRKGAR